MKVCTSFLRLGLFIFCLVVHSNIANALSVTYPENGLYYIRPECALDKVLSVQGTSKNWGANVIIDNFNSNGSTWKLTRVDGDWYTITAIHSDLTLNVSDTPSSTQAGTGLNISTTSYCGENRNKFRFLDAGNGYYFIQACIPGNYVLDVFNRDNRAGTNVWCYILNETPAQRWKLESKNSLNDQTFQQRTVPIQDGWYRIQPMHDLGRSIDALGSQIGSGNNIHMWTNVEASQQKFYLQNRGNGYFSLQSAYGSQLFVTADGRGNGANLYTASWNNSDSQLFRLIATGDNSYHIFSKVGVNLNFDCAGGGKSDGNNVQLWTTENSAWHKWRFTKVSVNDRANFKLSNYSLSNPANYQIRFTGRLWNENNSSEITGLHVYIGGGVGAGGEFIGEFKADKSNHSFDRTINVPQNRTGNQLIVIYAVNGVESKELDRRNINVLPVSNNYVYPVEGYYSLTTLFYYENVTKSLGHRHSVWWHQSVNEGGHFNALDIACPNNTPVRAVASGKISNEFSSSSSNVIVIEHNDGMIKKSLYAHLSQKLVRPGDEVSAGQIIGTSGDKGASWVDNNGVVHHAYHLHLEWFNSSPWEYYRDKVRFKYHKSTERAFNKWCLAEDRQRFSEAINWIKNYGGGFTGN